MGDELYCSNIDNLSSDRCKSFCFDNFKTCDSLTKFFCSSSLYTDREMCQTYCFNHPGACDTAMQRYCDAHPDAPLCACITSNLKNPICYDNQCLVLGYKTAAHVLEKDEDPACNTMDCNLYYAYKKDPNFNDSLEQKQHCVERCKARGQGCDLFMDHYCRENENKDRPECSCYTSEYRQLGYDPSCYDGACQMYGYRPHLSSDCSAEIQCDASLKQFPTLWRRHCTTEGEALQQAPKKPWTSNTTILVMVGFGVVIFLSLVAVVTLLLWKRFHVS